MPPALQQKNLVEKSAEALGKGKRRRSQPTLARSPSLQVKNGRLNVSLKYYIPSS